MKKLKVMALTGIIVSTGIIGTACNNESISLKKELIEINNINYEEEFSYLKLKQLDKLKNDKIKNDYEKEWIIKLENYYEEKHRLIELKRIEKEKDKKLELIKLENTLNVTNEENILESLTMKISHYGNDCGGCSGITATGISVKNTIYYQGMNIIATDPTVIPLWSIVELELPTGTVIAISLDTGGAIKGNKIDFLVGSESESYSLGVYRNVKVNIIRKGK